MLEPRGEADLALEALGAQGMCEIGMEDLERDRAVMPEVLGQEDGRHPAPAELALDHVAGKRGLESGAQVRQSRALIGDGES